MSQKAASTEAERKLQAARRSGARLAAVQALYQMELGGASIEEVLAEFETWRLGQELFWFGFERFPTRSFVKYLVQLRGNSKRRRCAS